MAAMQTKYWAGLISQEKVRPDEADLSGGEWASENAGKGETCEGTRGPIPAHFESSLIGPHACASSFCSRDAAMSMKQTIEPPLRTAGITTQSFRSEVKTISFGRRQLEVL